MGGGTVGHHPRLATSIWVGVGVTGSRRRGWGERNVLMVLGREIGLGERCINEERED